MKGRVNENGNRWTVKFKKYIYSILKSTYELNIDKHIQRVMVKAQTSVL